MKDTFYIGTSWKMHKTAAEAVAYLRQLKELLPERLRSQVFVVTPFTALWQSLEAVQGSPILIGAQNMHWADEGPYTGEISPKMLAETGAHLVELAHSERRAYYNENDQDVNKKVHAALAHRLIPLVCVGERQSDKDYGVSAEFLSIQLRIALHGLRPDQAERVWIAYEPVWAIGEGGRPADPAYADELQACMRSVLVDLFGPASAQRIPILYGGSVNRTNAVALARMQHIDGLFIGRAAWAVDSFLELIRAVEQELV